MKKAAEKIEDLNSRIAEELEKQSGRFHIIGAWVAVFFNPVFSVTDYFNIPDNWHRLLFIRLSISLITLSLIFLRKRFRWRSFLIVLTPFLLISLQNAYTFDLIGKEQFSGHTYNYIALLIGAGMFVLWHWYYSAAVIALSIIATLLFIGHNPNLSMEEVIVSGGLLLFVVALFMILLIQTRYRLVIRNIKSKLALEASNLALAEQKTITEKKNKSITDSIRYAERIQKAMLPSISSIKERLPDSFILYKPKDIVSGDFFWFSEDENTGKLFIAAVDCTGHGVPGAFMSMIGDLLLNKIVNEKRIHSPSAILEELHLGVKQALNQENNAGRDGMDMTLCMIDATKNTLEFAGAKNPLIFVQNGKAEQLKGDKRSIGGKSKKADRERPFSSRLIHLDSPATFYMFSDGYQDQFGGVQKRKFMIKRMRNLLLEIHEKPFSEQKEILNQSIENWRSEGGEEQIDDILVIGFKIDPTASIFSNNEK